MLAVPQAAHPLFTEAIVWQHRIQPGHREPHGTLAKSPVVGSSAFMLALPSEGKVAWAQQVLQELFLTTVTYKGSKKREHYAKNTAGNTKQKLFYSWKNVIIGFPLFASVNCSTGWRGQRRRREVGLWPNFYWPFKWESKHRLEILLLRNAVFFQSCLKFFKF